MLAPLHRPHRPRAPSWLAVTAGCVLLAWLPAHGQYKVVDAQGRVTYTDRPAIAAPDTTVAPMRATAAPAVGAALPYALQQVVGRYPVTLYTRGDCSPCDQGRALLQQRGVPFTEKTVNTGADTQAFQRIEAADALPVLRIGAQQLRAFDGGEWIAFLDAAGYPAQSQLPPGYRAPAATSLAATAPAPKMPPPQPAPNLPATLPPALETAPNGIRF